MHCGDRKRGVPVVVLQVDGGARGNQGAHHPHAVLATMLCGDHQRGPPFLFFLRVDVHACL